MKLLSILVPTFNRLDLTKRLIFDLHEQVRNDNLEHLIEIIVCDNSTNNEEKCILSDYISSLNDFTKYYDTGSNIGPTENWIQCISHAESAYSFFIFSDDYLKPGGLFSIVDLLKNNDLDILFLKAQIDKNGALLEYLNYSAFLNLNLRELLFLYLTTESLPVSPGCTVLRTNELKVLNFEEILSKYPAAKSMGAGSDAFMIYKCLKNANKVKFINSNIVVLRDHNESYTGNVVSKKNVIRSIAILKLNLLKREFGFISFLFYFIKKQFDITFIRMRINLFVIK
jgi:hypothetical protein